MMKSTLFFSTLSLFPWLTPGFDLGTSTENWGLTTQSLDKYTSHACRTAYEASIDCSDTLLALVSSPDPEYMPTADHLDATCTDTCRSSIENYIKNVEEVCSSSWDWALVSTAPLCTDCRLLQTPVENVGKIFQYKLESACALDRYGSHSSSHSFPDESSDGIVISNYDYCYLHPPYDGTDFPCTDTCSIDYYKTAHAHPASQLKFRHLWLVEESNYWKLDFENGYKRAIECESPV